ncbi:uncharacterized protein LOC128986762 [Macrosteles quadrilineatus]|uniref:uncharacterized protein LOC128986762 n=1 Tax=Macrosteles quadrilineatus TaxID=74068 RepID=UPI0023E2FEB5|nr:uncharacterized protein LOC128986762 [Macrosteles quadrilineatus]
MNLIQSILLTSVITFCSAQVFPFSNLRAFFDPKKQGRDGGVSGSGTNVSRPHRQADGHDHLPSLAEFDSPDIFTINREIEESRVAVKRHPTDSPSGRKGNGRHRINTHLDMRNPDSDGSIFITPKPNHKTEYATTGEEYPQKSNRGRIRKPQIQAEPDVEQSQYEVQSEKTSDDFQFGNSNPSNPFTSEGRYIESVPQLAVPIEDNLEKLKENDGLVDYLVPPKLPSVYEKALKLSKTRKPHRPSKLKSPVPTDFSKKEGRYRPKKHRDSGAPPPDRTTKRHVMRRRPHQRKPSRKPPAELAAAAAQMDEQITSETGFTGLGAHGAHGAGSHGNERVEFQMHGQKGPNSYKFGYDTGKGHNRQFRFEEKDNHGRVKGHYGYYDKEGKLQIVNYEADPHSGFKAESV